ncbi:MAG: recombinase family protein [Xanthobacteraceae bacterium]
MKRAAVYLRVSTLDQTTINQERELRGVASRIGCEIVKVYKDHGISGAKGRDKRPAFDALCRDATQCRFDIVMAWSVDRLGRSLQDLVGFLSELHALHIDLFLHQQGLDTTTPSGKAMFQMLGVFAEFERAMTQERVRAGLARARADGKILGRPKIAEKTERAVQAALSKKERPGLRKIAASFGVGVGTVQRIYRELT